MQITAFVWGSVTMFPLFQGGFENLKLLNPYHLSLCQWKFRDGSSDEGSDIRTGGILDRGRGGSGSGGQYLAIPEGIQQSE